MSPFGRLERVAVLAYHSSPLVPPGSGDAGGMSVYVLELARALAASGIATDIFTRATDGSRIPQIVAPRVRVIPIAAGPPAPLPKERLPEHLTAFVDGIRAFAVAQRLAYDVIHSHYWQSGLAGRDLAAAWDIPLVHSHHTLAKVKNLHLAPGDAPEPAARIAGEASVISAADVLIASTDDEYQQLACLYGVPHDSLKTIPPGVDHALFSLGDRIQARRRVGAPDGDVLLYVGRIQRLKGLDLALHALADLAKRREAAPVLLVVGGASGADGDREVDRLNKVAADLGVTDLVRFLGPRPHDRLPDLYRAADVALVTSYSESFGLVALEAQSCGTPVVGTPVGGLSHIVEDGRTGFLLPERDPIAFAAAIDKLLSDKALHAGFARAAQTSAARFSWTRVADRYAELYSCLAIERSPEACTC